MTNDIQKHSSIYDILTKWIIVWCVLQDFVLCVLFRFTGWARGIKIFFFNKDIIMVLLFVVAIYKTIKNKTVPKIMIYFYAAYYLAVACQLGNTVMHMEAGRSVVSLLSSTRGLILLPTLIIIGYAIDDKEAMIRFFKRYFILLIVVAVIGIVEFILDITVGTKSFWMSTLQIENYSMTIKGQSTAIYGDSPANWYTDVGHGYRSQKRLISIWMAPLTAGFVLLVPSLYYSLTSMKSWDWKVKFKDTNWVKNATYGIVCILSLALTFTRQTFLPFIALLCLSFLYYAKEKRKFVISGLAVLTLCFAIVFKDKIYAYLFNGSTLVHMMSFSDGVKSVTFWGAGVGTYGSRFYDTIGTESQYLTVIGQLGVIPFVLYMIIFIQPVLFCMIYAKNVSDKYKTLVCAIIFAGITYCAAGLVSETVAAYTSIAQYYILIGAVWSMCRESKKETENIEDQSNSNVSSSVS